MRHAGRGGRRYGRHWGSDRGWGHHWRRVRTCTVRRLVRGRAVGLLQRARIVSSVDAFGNGYRIDKIRRKTGSLTKLQPNGY